MHTQVLDMLTTGLLLHREKRFKSQITPKKAGQILSYLNVGGLASYTMPHNNHITLHP